MGSVLKKESEYTIAWRKRNPEKHKEYMRKYRQTPQYKEYRKKWRESHREERARKGRERYYIKRQKTLDIKREELETLRTFAFQRKDLLDGEKMALIGGLVSGEGTLGLNWNRSKKSFNPKLIIANTELELLTPIKESLGGCYTTKPAKGNRKTGYMLNISGRDAVFNALIELYPYLLGKRQQIAELMMEWIISRSCRIVTGKEFITPKEYKLFEEIRILNHRGRSFGKNSPSLNNVKA